MFIGTKETQQAAVQKLLEATIYLRRANDSFMAIQPILSDLRDQQRMTSTRMTVEQEANHYMGMYLSSAKEAFNG